MIEVIEIVIWTEAKNIFKNWSSAKILENWKVAAKLPKKILEIKEKSKQMNEWMNEWMNKQQFEN